VNLIVGDGILECENCGYGFAPLDDIEIHGSYRRFQECIGVRYAVSNEAQQKIPKPKMPNWDSYHVLLKEIEIQRSVGLPDDPELKCRYAEASALQKKLWAENELVQKWRDSCYPKCPHEKKENRKLYDVPLIIEMRKSVGLPDDPKLIEESKKGSKK
jgi:hypothetical protein